MFETLFLVAMVLVYAGFPLLGLVIYRVTDVSRRAARAKAAATNGWPIWRVDRTWSDVGEARRGSGRFRGPLGAIAVSMPILYFAGIPASIAFGANPGVVLLLFAVSGVVLLVLLLRTNVGMRLLYGRFPFVVGEAAEFRLRTYGGNPRAERLELTLRCVRRRQRARGFARSEREVLHEEHRLLADELPGGHFEVAFSFVPPEDLPGTSLLTEPSVAWELEVSADGRRGPTTQSFLLPIYDRGLVPADPPPPVPVHADTPGAAAGPGGET